MNKPKKIILGIDPGTIILGYGLIKIDDKDPKVIGLGVVKLGKIANPYERLGMIYRRIEGIIEEFNPFEVAIEAPFYGKNVQSMLKLGRAQGVALSPAINRNIPVFEYAPRKIKQSITGNGNASKEQVAHMIQKILKFQETPQYLDATDGIAAALCHYYQMQLPKAAKSYKNWEDFLRKNPNRIK